MLPQPTPVQTSLPRPSASLYVGNLASDVTEANLFEIFNQVGLVASIRVCRDTTTRRSLGYAYVNFQNPNDAERALDTLNYASIKGRACRIMWSQRDPSFRKSGVGNIFIKNLDKSIDNKSLHDTFSAFGNILSCRVMTDEHGNSRGFGFVHFENAESAEQAKAKVDGMLLANQQVFVGLYVSKKERAPKYEELKKTFTNVFVKNLDESVEEEEFLNLFRPHGQITSSIIMKDEAGKSRGFGFVNFQTHESAENACNELNELDFHGKKLFVGRAQKSSERKEELQRKHEASKQERHNKFPGVNLYVRNLEDQINDEALRNEFKEFGTITSAKVAVDERGNSKGFGFVCYSSPEEATRALAEMNGKMIGGKPIFVSPHQRKEVRRQQLEIHYAQNSRLAMQQGFLPNGLYPQGVYYPAFGVPPQARGQQFMGYSMMARPRWPGPQQGAPAQPELVGGYPPQLPGAQVPRPRPMSSAPRTRAPQGAIPSRAPLPNGLPAGQPQIPNQGGPRSKSTYRYNSNVRNRVDQPPAAAAVPVPLPAQFPLNPTVLAEAPPEVQKRLLGEKLFFLIAPKLPEYAPKITGMLLDMDNSELLHLLDSNEALQTKVEEAMAVLLESEAQTRAQAEAEAQAQAQGQN